MKNVTLVCAFTFAAVVGSASAIDINIHITDFKTASENSSSLGDLSGGTSTTATQTYTLTNLDFTSIGGTASETINFSVDLSGTSGGSASTVGYKTWGDAFVGGSNTEVGEVLTATLGTITSSFTGGTVAFAGFTNAFIEALITGEEASVGHAGGMLTVLGTADNEANQAIPLSPWVSMAPTVGSMNIGGYDLRLTAVPEPASASLLLGIACVSGVLFRRSRR